MEIQSHLVTKNKMSQIWSNSKQKPSHKNKTIDYNFQLIFTDKIISRSYW